MHTMKLKRAIALAVLLIVAGLALPHTRAARADDDNRAPELPAPCADLQVPPGHEVAFRVYAVGVQVYKWNGAGWDFDGPVASLFADEGYRGLVGTHYRGPAWESNSGSRVFGKNAIPCTPDPTAISWLRLEGTSQEGNGIFSAVTYIQRVNTSGGLRPAATDPGPFVGAERRVPYTTEYYFYRIAE